ncbi:MAG: hypothetical protein Q7S68_02700 [Deltaproteobacteria bacterium]|nr:hypothetical protein [Deltaproteobacteria bacterium]
MKKIFLTIFLLVLLAPVFSFAQTKDGAIQVGIGTGVALNPPARFNIDANGEYFLNDTYSVGVSFDTFIRKGESFGLSAFGRYRFELIDVPRLEPFLGAGIGGLFSTNNREWFDVMLPEMGAHYELTPLIRLGLESSFHILAGSSTTWDYQILYRIAFRF